MGILSTEVAMLFYDMDKSSSKTWTAEENKEKFR